MDAVVEVQQPPVRETLRDARGVVIGVIERQWHAGKLIARNKSGIVVGSFYDGVTRNARGQIVARANVLSGLLLVER